VVRLLPLILVLCVGCPMGDDDDSAPGVVYEYPQGDAADTEPNDSAATAQALGVLGSGYRLTGLATACGENGTWDSADVDWFSFSPASADPFTLRLEMWGGDLDLAVFDSAGDLLVDGAESGVADEELSLALDPMATWLMRVRCWQGNPSSLWRLRLQ